MKIILVALGIVIGWSVKACIDYWDAYMASRERWDWEDAIAVSVWLFVLSIVSVVVFVL